MKQIVDWEDKLKKAQDSKAKFNQEVSFLKDKLISLERESAARLKQVEQRVLDEEESKYKILQK